MTAKTPKKKKRPEDWIQLCAVPPGHRATIELGTWQAADQMFSLNGIGSTYSFSVFGDDPTVKTKQGWLEAGQWRYAAFSRRQQTVTVHVDPRWRSVVEVGVPLGSVVVQWGISEEENNA
jgi:hypothetical protein